jgi:hypothetical protein
MATTTELYESGIERLQAYVDEEPDKEKRDAATNHIRQLRVAIQEAAFDEMSQRSERLQELTATLQGIINTAGDGSGVSGAIAGIADFLGDLADV